MQLFGHASKNAEENMFSLHPLLSEVCLLLHSSGGFCTIVSSVDENNTWNAKGHRREQAFFSGDAGL